MSINNLNTYLNIKDSHLRVVSGNVYAQAMNIGGINVETAHGLQSVSDTGNVTSNTLQFSNAITGFVTTANAQIGRDLVVSGNATVSTDLTVSANAAVADTLTISEHLIASKEATVTGNLHVTTIRSDSNVVAEYTGPHDRPLRKYPEVALTQNDESATSGYVASGSTIFSAAYEYYEAFDLKTNLVDTNPDLGLYGTWLSAASKFDSSGIAETGIGTSNTFPGTSYRGEYCALKIPNAIKLDNFHIFPRGDASSYSRANPPKDLRVFGSNDGTTWTHIKQFQNLSFTGRTGLRLHVNDSNMYNEYAFFVEKITVSSAGETYCGISGIELYGHEEGSGSLDTTLKTVYNVPATTGTQLDVYYDAKGLDNGNAPTNPVDLSPNTNNATLGGDPQVSNGAFVFDGTGDYIYNSQSGYTTSDAYTASVWVKFLPDAGSSTDPCIFQFGNGSNRSSFGMISDSSKNRLRAFIFGNNAVDLFERVDNVWYHLCATYYASNGRTDFFINGILKKSVTSGTAMTIPSTPYLSIGVQTDSSNAPISTTYFTGSIANFRLYSKALNADQIKELYDYQKDYFLGSKSQVTLYKGHLGVGVTEPSGQLELAGDERIQEYPPGPMDDYETLIPGHGVFCAYAPNESANSNNPFAWKAFNKETSGSKWWFEHDSAPTYQYGTSSDTSQYANPVNIPYTTNGIVGLYIELKFPYAINLKSYALTARSTDALIGRRMPEEGVLFGSNDGVTWTAIHNHKDTGGNYTTGIGPRHFNVDDTSKSTYSYFRLVTTKLFDRSGGGGTSGETPNIGELKFFGTPGPTTLDKGSLTLGRSLDVPRVSRYDVDTETPRPEKLVVDYDTTVNSSPTDISGKGNHGVFKNDSEYSPADKAFKFDGDNDYIQTGSGSNVISGSAPPFTASVWVNNNSSDSTYASVFSIEPDTYGTNTNVWFYILSGKPTLQFENNYVEFYEPGTSTGGATRNIWHHLVVSYNGNSTIGGRRCWLNGVEQTSSAVAGSGNLTLGTTRLTLGVLYYGNNHVNDMTGKISNFKLYNVALEPSEVKKLYNLGRTGRSMVISDTAVGIGKVPEAQLDVRGNIKCDVIMPNVIAFSAYRTSPLALGDQSTTGSFQANNTYYNYGNAYNTSNGQFKAPIDGVYHINWNAFTNQTATSTSRIFLLKNGTIEFQKGNSIERHGNGISVDIHLNAGDYVTINGSSSYPLYFHGHAAHHHYSGYLVYAT